MSEAELDVFLRAGCEHSERCAQRLEFAPSRCLLVHSDQAEKRQRPKWRVPELSWPDLTPLIFTNEQSHLLYTRSGVQPLPWVGLRLGLQDAASDFRNWIWQDSLAVSRAEDRVALSGIARVDRQLRIKLGQLDADQHGRLGAMVAPLPPMPASGRQLWLLGVAEVVGALARSLSIVASPDPLDKIAKLLRELAQLFAALDQGETLLALYLAQSNTESNVGFIDSIAALLDALGHIRASAELVAGNLAARKGPGRNGNLRAFVGMVDGLMLHFRGTPLISVDGFNRDSKGAVRSQDEEWLIALLQIIFDSFPECVRVHNRRLFNPNAVIDALKEHSEWRNRQAI